ncbi:MAG: ATP-binding cassette domain-containing protein [Alphaproteobacteria bacterium]
MDGQDIHAVNRLSFQLEEDEIFGVVGESGCGKSCSKPCFDWWLETVL